MQRAIRWCRRLQQKPQQQDQLRVIPKPGQSGKAAFELQRLLDPFCGGAVPLFCWWWPVSSQVMCGL